MPLYNIKGQTNKIGVGQKDADLRSPRDMVEMGRGFAVRGCRREGAAALGKVFSIWMLF
jgi:hypothetical protein